MNRQDFIKSNNEIDYVAYASYLESEKNQLIEYLEKFISETDYQVNVIGNYLYLGWSEAYKKLLERVRSGKYE